MSGEPLTPKEKALIAMSASVAAGCQTCYLHHLEAARAAGACETGTRKATAIALSIRDSATNIVSRWTERYLTGATEAAEPAGAEERVIFQLMAVAAALAVNCPDNLAAHVASARRLGATARQIQATLGIARSIKRLAADQADETIFDLQQAENQQPVAVAAPANGGASCGCSQG